LRTKRHFPAAQAIAQTRVKRTHTGGVILLTDTGTSLAPLYRDAASLLLSGRHAP
jgi:hypothetical protein